MTLHKLLPLAFLSVASLARADVPGVAQFDVAKPPPAGIKPKGARLVQLWTWTGKGGAPAYLALSTTSHKGKGESRQLYAQVYGGKPARELRLVKDGVERCQLDLVASFVTGSVTIGDADGDGAPEVAFAYDLDCDAKADPSPRKLIVIEGDAKHALRGQSMGKDPDDKPMGGDYKADPFAGEEKLKAWAEARWKALLAVEPTAVDP